MKADAARVLVLDANGQAGLSVVRSLGRRGVAVTAGSHVRQSLGRHSRFSAGTYHHPDPADSAEAFVDHLVDYLTDVDHVAVLPVSDLTSMVCSTHKQAIEATGTAVGVEDWPTFERAFDKGTLFEIAEPLSVPTPRTETPQSLDEVAAMSEDVTYPVVVKPRSKTTIDAAGRSHKTRIDDTSYATSPAELLEAYRAVLDRNPVLVEQDYYPLVQEWIPGRTTTTVVIAESGTIRTYFQEVRLRTHPSSGGTSTLLRGVDEPRMLAYASAVIDALDWTGPAMVEFMETPDGEFYLIEVNGRYWGSVPFAIESGVDVPWLHYQQLRGTDPAFPESYQVGFRFHRLVYGDLKWLAEQLGRGNYLAPLTVGWACLTARQQFISVTDPLPTLSALAQGVGMATRALRNRLGESGG